MEDAFDLLTKLFTPKVVECSNVNILHNDFYKNVIYNGPPMTENRSGMFRMLAANMGTEFAIIWALDLSGVRLLKYITNPSSKVVAKAISIDNDLYNQYKDELIEEDLITIVQMSGSGIFGPEGWKLLYKLDPQPIAVIKAAIDYKSEAIKAVKEQTPELCEYLVLQNKFYESDLNHIKFRTPKIENKILEKVLEGKWSLKYLSKELMTRQLIEKTLVKNYNSDLRYIVGHRDDLIDESLIEISISNPDSRNIEFIPDQFKSLDVCRKIVKLSRHNLKFVPSRYRFNEIVDKEFVKDSLVYKRIENEYITSGLVKMIDSFNTATKKTRFNFINNCTEEEILILLEYYPNIYGTLWEDKRTIKITEKAVTLEGWNIQYVPDAQYNIELYEIAIASRPGAVKHKRHD